MITAQQLDRITAEVLRRLNKRVLALLTNARGYRTEIYARLRMEQAASFSFLLAEDATAVHCEQRWGKLGPVLTWSPRQLTEISQFDALLLPFLDFSTVGKIANGIIDNRIMEVISQALLRGMGVFAFDYNCNPGSELNSVLGYQQDNGYSCLMQQHLVTVANMGVKFITVNELGPLLTAPQAISQQQALSQQATPQPISAHRQQSSTMSVNMPANRYITLKDLLEQRVTQLTPEMKLTALAQEYIKENRQKGKV